MVFLLKVTLTQQLSLRSEIFKALARAKLIVANRKESCYSRCGRTDKGVSATGQ
ncbi:Pseudouridine synthase family protein, partial [Zea mays]